MKRNANNKKSILAFVGKYPIYFVLIALIIFMCLASDVFLTSKNLLNVFTTEATRGVLAVAVSFAILSRGIDLSVGSIVSLVGVVSCSLVQERNATRLVLEGIGYVPTWAAILICLIIGLVIGLINGTIVAYLKVPPFITTLGTMMITEGVALIYTDGYPVSMLRADFKTFGQYKLFGFFPIGFVYFISIAVLAWVILNKTRLGKRLYAVGGNANAARVAGINVEQTLVAAYVWSAVISAFAGLMLAARTGSAMGNMGDGYEMDAIAAATVGGVSQSGGIGTVGGIIIGVAILAVINNGLLLLGTSTYFQNIIKGIIIIGAVAIDMYRTRRK